MACTGRDRVKLILDASTLDRQWVNPEPAADAVTKVIDNEITARSVTHSDYLRQVYAVAVINAVDDDVVAAIAARGPVSSPEPLRGISGSTPDTLPSPIGVTVRKSGLRLPRDKYQVIGAGVSADKAGEGDDIGIEVVTLVAHYLHAQTTHDYKNVTSM